jgi:hypothetical protein
MKPDSNNYNPNPLYLRELLDKADISQLEAARILRIESRTFRYYLADPKMSKHVDAPYVVQFALECLANNQSV